jgi:hypothetical protein
MIGQGEKIPLPKLPITYHEKVSFQLLVKRGALCALFQIPKPK